MTTLLSGGPRSHKALDDEVDLARDRILVTRAQAGDRSAFDDLYVRYYRRLYRFCVSRLHDSHEAEDVAQEAFSRAWRALSAFDGERRFYPWLSVIAAHLCTDVHRRRKRSTPVAEFYQGNLASTEDGGEELVLAAVDSDLVARAFKRLSDRHQRILRLREGSEWSYQKIAEHEGLQTTAVETLLWRARQALKREFAALARAEGRIAAFIGGALSLAAFRRFIHLAQHRGRRILQLVHGGAAMAMGSAAAATAAIVVATLNGPMAQGPAQAPTVSSFSPVRSVGANPLANVTSAAGHSMPESRATIGVGGVPVATASISAAQNAPSQTNSQVPPVSPADNVGTGGTGGVGGVGGVGAAIDVTRGGLAGGASSAAQAVSSDLGSVTAALSEPLAGLGAAVSQSPLGPVATAVSGTLTDTAGSGTAAVVGTVQGGASVANGLVGSGSSGASGSSAGISWGASATGGSSSASSGTGSLGGLLGAVDGLLGSSLG